MNTTVVGLFDDVSDARAAADELVRRGVGVDHISLIKDCPCADAPVDATISAAFDDAARVSVPGIGAACGRGPLVRGHNGSPGDGAIASGLAGALVKAGIDERHAYEYLAGVRRGGTLLAVRADDATRTAVAKVLLRHSALDIDRRFEQWRAQDRELNGRRQDTLGLRVA